MLKRSLLSKPIILPDWRENYNTMEFKEGWEVKVIPSQSVQGVKHSYIEGLLHVFALSLLVCSPYPDWCCPGCVLWMVRGKSDITGRLGKVFNNVNFLKKENLTLLEKCRRHHWRYRQRQTKEQIPLLCFTLSYYRQVVLPA